MLQDARPDIPDDIGDRAVDIWEPLLAISDMAGGIWPDVARLAARRLSVPSQPEDSSGVRLLGDIKHVFNYLGANRVRSNFCQ